MNEFILYGGEKLILYKKFIIKKILLILYNILLIVLTILIIFNDGISTFVKIAAMIILIHLLIPIHDLLLSYQKYKDSWERFFMPVDYSKNGFLVLSLIFSSNTVLDKDFLIKLTDLIVLEPKSKKLLKYNFLIEETNNTELHGNLGTRHSVNHIEECLKKEPCSVHFYQLPKWNNINLIIDFNKNNNYKLWKELKLELNLDNVAFYGLSAIEDYLHNIIKFLCNRTNVIYGRIFLENHRNVIWEDCTAKVFHDEDLIKIINETQGQAITLKNAYMLKDYIPKAYWGNILNNEHLSKLGDIKSIKESIPAFLFKEYSNGCFIQLTKYLNDLGRKESKERISLLEEYFKPILIQTKSETT